MTEDKVFPVQLEAVLDNAPVGVLVSEIKSKRILYLNRLAKDLFVQGTGNEPAFCYQIAGLDKACPFCRAQQMSLSELMTREFHHPDNGRIYQLNGKIIDWGGVSAHIEYVLDVTERKREEEKSKALHEKLQEIFNNVQCGLCVYRMDNNKIVPVFHNAAFYEVMGYSDEHIQMVEKETDYLGVHPEDLDLLEQKVRNVVQNEGTTQHTYRVWNDRKQRYIWICLQGTVKFYKDGTKILYGVYSDVSERLRIEQYFQTIMKKLPGGIAVVRYTKEGTFIPEYISEGFAVMTQMTMEEAWQMYETDALAGVHPDDQYTVKQKIHDYMADSEKGCEIAYRLRTGNNNYIWVKNTLSVIQSDDGEAKTYSVFHDITKEREEQDRIRKQYNELIVQHYRAPGPGALIVGHCNVTQGKIFDIVDYTNSDLLATFGTDRERFFMGLSGFIVDQEEQEQFRSVYLNKPALEAYARGETELLHVFFARLPGDLRGRYVQVKMNMVVQPDNDDVTGILTVQDVTEKTVADRMLHQMSIMGYDFVVDMDLYADRYKIVFYNHDGGERPPQEGSLSGQIAYMLANRIVPKDHRKYQEKLDPAYMLKYLEKGAYSFAFSIKTDEGDIRIKKMNVSALDLRLGRACLSRTDITVSVREQQGLLNMIAYTFELACFVQVSSRRLTMYTRRTVLENLSPHLIEDYDHSVGRFTAVYGTMNDEHVLKQFELEGILHRLREKPSGYDFVFVHSKDGQIRYKQVNVLWGDENHSTVCMVRADVTDMLTAERQTKKDLENALALAEEANRAKSDFLSAMSHDIRTPMNAIIGMTALASAHSDDRMRVEDCLEKISVSSRHLMRLINDVLDMSKIERAKITLNRGRISILELLRQLSVMIEPQMKNAGLLFDIHKKGITHTFFYGDALRINQILINILSNAVKFTPEGGRVDFEVEELLPLKEPDNVRYRFTISDTGIGMSETFQAHLFEAFSRSNRVSNVQGTGLGLSITKGLVELMEGTIAVESQIDKGSVFQVELEFPSAQEQPETAARPENIIKDGGYAQKLLEGCCFLVAEDNAINAEIICGLLEMDGARTVIKTDGAQAVQAFQEAAPGDYDAVLMDIRMPEMNGYTAARTIRSSGHPDAKTIPIIAMTANAYAEDVKEAFDAGMNAHLSKPIDVNEMRTTLKNFIQKSAD